jgi:hypothetical protein
MPAATSTRLGKLLRNLRRREEFVSLPLRELSDKELKVVHGGIGDWLGDSSNSLFLTQFLSGITLFLYGFTSMRQKKAPTIVKPETRPLPIHYPYPHTSVPDHAPRLVEEGKFQSKESQESIIFARQRSQYDSDYLQKNAERLTQRFLDALQNPQDPLSPAAKQGLHIFAETMAKSEGSTLSQAAIVHNIPLASLAEWVDKDLVPTIYRDKNATYISEETSQKTADIHRRAKEKGKQTARQLREMRSK